MNLLVTGGAGYIGSHFVKEAVSQGHEIIVLDDLSTGHRGSVAEPSVGFYGGDYGDEELVKRIIRRHRPEAVIHFAGASLVGESMANPAKYYLDIEKTGTLLSCMEEAGIDCMIFSSSAAVYGAPASIPVKEDAQVRPVNPYGDTKLRIEETIRKRSEKNGLKYVCLRYFNACGAASDGTIGEDHHPETHLIPRLLAAAGRGGQCQIYGTHYPTVDGTCVRDYIHVEDLARGHLLALEYLKRQKPGSGECVNLGTEKGFSVLQVVDQVEKITGYSFKRVEKEARDGDPAVLIASTAKARDLLGWSPAYTDLGKMIETAWNWHRSRA